MKQKILIVDDEKRIRKLIRLYLEREEDYELYEAEDGPEALEKALEIDFHCIILDLMLPGMDGMEVARELRQKKSTPIIMLTAIILSSCYVNKRK